MLISQIIKLASTPLLVPDTHTHTHTQYFLVTVYLIFHSAPIYLSVEKILKNPCPW